MEASEAPVGGRLPISGYILAGGKSSRMGTDKALLPLAGKPLIEHAVSKLRRICEEIHILSSSPELAVYAPLIPDLHPGCGPIGGIEAALAHSTHDWNLILPVDVPFLPTVLLYQWARAALTSEHTGGRLAMYTVRGVPQPALLMVHRDLGPYMSKAIARCEFKLLPALQSASRDLAAKLFLEASHVLRDLPATLDFRFDVSGEPHHDREPWMHPTPAQQAAIHLWFDNLNTPQDFAEAQDHLDALDT